MRNFLRDIGSALNATEAPNEARLYGHYSMRTPKPSHCRPLPLPDALLQGCEVNEVPKIRTASWIAEISSSPWLWQLQWATMTVLVVSPELRAQLSLHCPSAVAKQWVEGIEDRFTAKVLGGSVKEGFPESTAALTPLMTVVSEMMALRLSYERR